MDEHLAKKDAQVSNNQENVSFTHTVDGFCKRRHYPGLSSPILSESKPGDKCHPAQPLPATVVVTIHHCHHHHHQILHLTFRFEVWILGGFTALWSQVKFSLFPSHPLEERKTCICDDMLGFFHLSRSSIMPVRTNGARMKTNSPRSCVYGASLSWN